MQPGFWISICLSIFIAGALPTAYGAPADAQNEIAHETDNFASNDSNAYGTPTKRDDSDYESSNLTSPATVRPGTKHRPYELDSRDEQTVNPSTKLSARQVAAIRRAIERNGAPREPVPSSKPHTPDSYQPYAYKAPPSNYYASPSDSYISYHKSPSEYEDREPSEYNDPTQGYQRHSHNYLASLDYERRDAADVSDATTSSDASSAQLASRQLRAPDYNSAGPQAGDDAEAIAAPDSATVQDRGFGGTPEWMAADDFENKRHLTEDEGRSAGRLLVSRTERNVVVQ